MGSSYRQDLNNGQAKGLEFSLKEAVRLIEEVREELYRTIGDDGQFDNAADDGRLLERLLIARDLIQDELPKQDGQRPSDERGKE
mgnify:CR=1 FL=1